MMKARLYLYIMGKYKALQTDALEMFSQRPPAAQPAEAGILHINTQHQKSGHLGLTSEPHFAAVLNKNSSREAVKNRPQNIWVFMMEVLK